MRPLTTLSSSFVRATCAFALVLTLAGRSAAQSDGAEGAPAPSPPPSTPAVVADAGAATDGRPVRAENGDLVRDLSFAEDLRHGGDLSLVGIFSFGSVQFGVPDDWELVGQPELHLSYKRSAQLIPEVSSITVWVDGQPVGTFPLDGDPNGVDTETLPLVLLSESGYHNIQFVAYHRSLLPCEISDHPGLWSRILGNSFIRVRYRPVTPALSLSDWPRPFRDDRDPDSASITMVIPENPSEEEIQAAGYIASYLGHEAPWLPMDLHLHQGGIHGAPAGHLIVVGRADSRAAVFEESKALMTASQNPELQDTARGLSAASLPRAGVIALAPRPSNPHHAVLMVLGTNGPGVVQLSQLLSGQEASQLPVGVRSAIDEVETSPPMNERAWEDTIPTEPAFTLQDLGLADQTASGYRGGAVNIPLRLIPDEHPRSGAARLELIYSYTAQASSEQSRLDVYLNGVATGGVALHDMDGRHRQKLLLDLPVHELGPESNLEVKFSLIGKEPPICLGEHHDEMWGTVHSDTRLTLPRDQWATIPDLSLLRYGGYPFTLRADLSDTLFVLPAEPQRADYQAFIWLAAEFGRVSRGDRFAYGVQKGPVRAEKVSGLHLVVVESGRDAEVIKSSGLLPSMSFSIKKSPFVGLALADGGGVVMGADARVAYLEEMVLPWDENRAALVAFAADGALFERVGPCLETGPLFDRLAGKVTQVASCLDLAIVPAEQVKILGEQPAREAAYVPVKTHYWWIILGLVLLAAFILLVGIMLRKRRSRREGEDFEEYEEYEEINEEV